MDSQVFNDNLLKVLEKEVLKEKWKKKAKIVGKVIRKRITNKGSFMFTIKTKNYKNEIVVPEHRKIEFVLAKTINEGDRIKVIGDKQITGIVFCERIKKLSKLNFKEKQMKIFN